MSASLNSHNLNWLLHILVLERYIFWIVQLVSGVVHIFNLDYVISLWLLRVDSSEAEGQRLVFPGSVLRLRRFVHILLVDNELAQPKTNGGTMERAARNKKKIKIKKIKNEKIEK